MRILVTGITGMIGRAVVPRLLACGHQVIGAMRDPSLALDWPEVRRVRLDLDAGNEVMDPRSVSDVECIIHLAGRAHIMRQTASDRAMFHRENTAGTQALARVAAQAGVRRFLYVSTVKVNGESTVRGPFGADDTPMPSDDYAVSKFAAERDLLELGSGNRMEVAIVRPTLVYGPYVRGNFRTLMRVVELGIPLPLRGLENSRSLVNTWNLAEFLETLATAPLPGNRVWMVSDGEDLSTADLIIKLAHAFRRRPRLFRIPFPLLEMAAGISGNRGSLSRLAGSLQVDISRSLADLPWRPRVTVDEALRRTAVWYLAMKSGSGG